MYNDRNAARVAIFDLHLDLINDGVLTLRLVHGQNNIMLMFSFRHDSIVQEQVAVWYEDGDAAELYVRRWRDREG